MTAEKKGNIKSFWTWLMPCLILFTLRISDYFAAYYNLDELTNTIFARMIVEGRMSLYDWLGSPYLLTHYFYAFAYAVNQDMALETLRLIHLSWCLGTSYILYRAGRLLTGNNQGGFWAAIFYVGISLSFMSKDYRAALSESFSILPISLGCLFFFKAIKDNSPRFTFLAAIFIGVASLFKAPAGILILPLLLVILLFKSKKRYHLPLAVFGLLVSLSSPFYFLDDQKLAFHSLMNNLNSSLQYIDYFDQLPFMYFLLKYMVRVFLVSISYPVVALFLIKAFRDFIYQRELNHNFVKKEELIFLILGFLCMCLVVNIGNRVFYHYFVFTFPFIVLLAAYSFEKYWRKLSVTSNNKIKTWLLILLILPPVGFSIESITGYSTQRIEFPKLTDYIINHTNTDDRIYIWGNLPQIYFDTKRSPASTFIWSDALAGISPGTPSMEYIRDKNKEIKLRESVTRDLKPSQYLKSEPHIHEKSRVTAISDRELILDEEILDSIENKYWRKVFEDFKINPPVLFLDSSPTGIKGFDKHPVIKYEILKRYLANNYNYETTIESVVIYRLADRGYKPR